MSDIWSDWLKHRRFGGDKTYQQMALAHVKAIAQKIIERADISESHVVLDIGAGDGLLGLSALERLGSSGKLILSDFSEHALAIPKEIFKEKKINDSRVQFLISSAEKLSLPSNSIDRVLMRAVLLYIEKKQDAFDEIYRILIPGGIAVILDPINKRNLEFGGNYFRGYSLDIEPLLSVKSFLLKIFKELSNYIPESFCNYTEHDLVHYCIKSGFNEIRLEYYASYNKQSKYASSKAFFDIATNPHSPTLRESMKKVLSKNELKIVEGVLEDVIKQPALRTSCEAMLVLKK
ncbi:MAG: methyltransferase domain-containing protein [Bacteroidetes bacterium]|nr:methyltransferase domain-containing protein [Bacteroidota bacterium]